MLLLCWTLGLLLGALPEGPSHFLIVSCCASFHEFANYF